LGSSWFFLVFSFFLLFYPDFDLFLTNHNLALNKDENQNNGKANNGDQAESGHFINPVKG
jgi:hypothetical protein